MAYPFVESPHINRTGGRQIDLIVIHTMEMDEKGETAENCAQWFRNPGAKVSAHYCVDANSIVQCVKDENVAWAAPGANSDGLQHRARRPREADRARLERRLFDRDARALGRARRRALHEVQDPRHVALRGRPHGREARDHDARRGQQGVQARHHWDPGTGFPVERYLGLIRAKLGTKAPAHDVKPLKDDPPLLKLGSEGWQVKRLQKLLRERGLFPEPAKIDGDFGEITEAAVKALQELNDLNPDGKVGPLTWRALQASDVKVLVRRQGPAARLTTRRRAGRPGAPPFHCVPSIGGGIGGPHGRPCRACRRRAAPGPSF